MLLVLGLEVLIPDPPDSHARLGIASPARRRLGRIGSSGGMGVICRWGDRRHFADRLDPVDGAMFVDEGDHFLNGRSSSAWAKYADALLLRSRSLRRNSQTSRSSTLIRSRSSVVGP